MAKYNIAVKVGHTKTAKGAYSPIIGESEYDYNLDVANFLASLSNDQVKIDVYTFDEKISSYTKRQKAVSDVLNKKNYDLVIELHYNAAESNTARGAYSLYYYKSVKGKEAALIIGNSIFDEFRIERDGDVGLNSDKQNGYQAVVTPKAVAILIEPFFGSNPVESQHFKGTSGKKRLASAIFKGVLKYLKI